MHSVNNDSESEVEILEPEDSIPVGDIDAFETLMGRKILLMKQDFYINGDLLYMKPEGRYLIMIIQTALRLYDARPKEFCGAELRRVVCKKGWRQLDTSFILSFTMS